MYVHAFLAILLLSSGCANLYLHNEKQLKEIQEAEKTWKEVTEDSNVFTAMLKNMEIIEKSEMDITLEQTHSSALTSILQIKYETWKELEKKVFPILKKAIEGFGETKQKVKEAESDLNEKEKQITEKKTQIEQLQKARKAIDEKDTKNVLEFLEKPIEAVEKALTDKGIKDTEALVGSIKLMQSLFKSLPKDVEKDIQKTILDLGLAFAKAELERLQEEERYLKELVDSIQLQRLHLKRVVYDCNMIIKSLNPNDSKLSELLKNEKFETEQIKMITEKDAREKQIRFLDKEHAALIEMYGEEWYDIERAKYVEPMYEVQVVTPWNKNNRILFTLKDSAEKAKGEPSIKEKDGEELLINSKTLAWQIRLLIRYSALTGYNKFFNRMRERQDAIIESKYRIKISAINAGLHQMLIGSGMRGLALYYENGITSNDIAKLVALAEGLAAIIVVAED